MCLLPPPVPPFASAPLVPRPDAPAGTPAVPRSAGRRPRGGRRARAASLPTVTVRLETRGDVTRLGAQGRALLDALCAASPDVIVLARTLPDRDGVRVLRALRAAGCRAAVTFERRAGARARRAAPVVAVFEPRVEGTGAPPGAAARDADAPLRARFGLSARESAVARLVASGHTNREIADLLDVSPFTARNHTSRVLRKLGARNRARVAALLADEVSAA